MSATSRPKREPDDRTKPRNTQPLSSTTHHVRCDRYTHRTRVLPPLCLSTVAQSPEHVTSVPSRPPASMLQMTVPSGTVWSGRTLPMTRLAITAVFFFFLGGSSAAAEPTLSMKNKSAFFSASASFCFFFSLLFGPDSAPKK